MIPSLVARGAVVLAAAALIVRADTSAFTIVDDAAMDAGVAAARAEFLAIAPFDRLDATILVEQPDGTWKRGSFNPDSVAYPASCVKLAYLAAAMRYQADHAMAFDALDASLAPMITVSSNVATGEVVDAITGTTNLPGVNSTASPQWPAWYAARLFTENYLDARGLLGNQVIVNKTYPTNSGGSPSGAEGVLISVEGANRMQPRLSASLMLEVVGGAIEAETGLTGSTGYMRALLGRDRFSDYSSIGFGLPPGSTNENKIGIAFDTLEDIAHFTLPNGTRCIVAAYSNGWDRTQPLPYDAAPLGTFTEMLLDKLGLTAGNPPKIVVDSADPGVVYAGAWSTGSAQPDKFGPSYRFASGGDGANAASFPLGVPSAGLYEVMAWWPAASNRATNTPFVVTHAGGTTEVRVDQTVWGGRWVKLGDFEFPAGGGAVTVSDDGTGSALVLADAVKATAWPSTCPADCDASGSLNVDDIDCFAAGFFGGDLDAADCDDNGLLNVDDIDCFAVAFLAGCP